MVPPWWSPCSVNQVVAERATLLNAGQAVTINVSMNCPKRFQVLEAFVYVSQDDSTSEFAPIPVECANKKLREYLVRVPASETPFHAGAATASAYVLLDEESGLSGGDFKEIVIQ